MTREEVAALLAYAVRLDPRTAPADQTAAEETLAQWADLLDDVPPTAPHPSGRHWDAARVVRHHVATSPYPIKPSDVSRPWHAFRADVVGRHHDPVPAVDPDDAEAYRAALLAGRHAVAAGAATATSYRELTYGTAAALTPAEQAKAAARRAALGEYMPRTVAQQLASYRPRRAERERLAETNAVDPLSVGCTWCGAEEGQPCRGRRINPRGGEIKTRARSTPHHCRAEDATAHHAQENAR